MSCVTWCNYEGDLPEKPDPDSKLCVWEVSVAVFSNWFRNEILGILEGNTPVIPTTMYIGIHSTNSTATTPGTELSGDGYSRTMVTFERVSDIQRWNANDVISAAATAEWPTVASYTLWDSSTGGNYYAYGNLAASISIDANKAIKWPANTLVAGLGSAAA